MLQDVLQWAEETVGCLKLVRVRPEVVLQMECIILSMENALISRTQTWRTIRPALS